MLIDTHENEDDEGEEDDDREDPDPSDQDSSDDDDEKGDEDTFACPFCNKPVYEGADVCPHCRNFITFSEGKTYRKLWVALGGVLALAAAIMAYVAFTVRGANP